MDITGNDLLKLIVNNGFAVFVAVWLLWERRTIMSNLTAAINAMTTAVITLHTCIDEMREELRRIK